MTLFLSLHYSFSLTNDSFSLITLLFFSHYMTLFLSLHHSFSLITFSFSLTNDSFSLTNDSFSLTNDSFSLTLSTGCECCAPTQRVQSCVPNSSVTPRGQRAPVSMATKNCTKTPSTTGKPATVIFVTLKHVSRPSVQEHHSRPSNDPVLEGHDLFQSLI